MTSDEFVLELAARLNSFIERSPQQALSTLSMPLPMVGFASVAQVFGVVSMPPVGNPEHLFLSPKVDKEGKLEGFECISGVELAKRVSAINKNQAERAQAASDGFEETSASSQTSCENPGTPSADRSTVSEICGANDVNVKDSFLGPQSFSVE